MTAADGTPPPDNVAALLRRRVLATPDGVAFHLESSPGQWTPLSWKTFGERVDHIARGLHAAGLQPGERLALIAPTSLAWELVHHAALAMGAVVVGLDAHDLPHRLAAMAELADVRAFACLDPAMPARIGGRAVAGARFILSLEAAGGSSAPPESGPRLLRLQHLERDGRNQPAPTPPGPDAEATIVFTSGTTGAAKGIIYRHGQLVQAIQAVREVFSFVPPDGHLLCWLPLSNLFQRMVNLAAVDNGTAVHLLSDPRRVMDVVAGVSPDIFIGVPRFYEKLQQGIRDRIAGMPAVPRGLARWAWGVGRQHAARLRQRSAVPWHLTLAHALADRLVLRRIRAVMGTRLVCMVSGSAPAPLPLLEELHGLGWLVLEAYGLSENVMPMAMNRRDDYRFGTVGRAMPGNEITIDAEGQLHVRGPGLMAGYIGDGSVGTVDVQGWYATGDLGRFDDEGYLVLTGRANDMIKTSTGRRVAPVPVEAALCSVPGVDQAMLLGGGLPYLVVLCTCLPGVDRAGLSRRLADAAAALPPAVRPAGIALLDQAFSLADGELTPNLKLRRPAIAERRRAAVDRLIAAIERRGTHDLSPLVL